MFALDLFNTRFERDLREGAVDDLEGRRIDDLNAKMQDLLGRARNASPEMKAGLKREFDKVKDERDSYFKVRNETMGYGTLVGEEGIPGNVPAEKIPGKEDLLKGKGRTYYEGDVTPVKGGIRHHAKPGNYGGYEPEADPLARLDKHAVNRADKAMGVKFDREKKYQGGLDLEVDEAGIPGSVPTEKIPGKEDLLKGKGRKYYEADQKKNSEQVTESQRLDVGDPIVVTGPNEFEGKTGEIDEFSPSGTFVIVNLYNHGKHSMHLSDIAYNEYADQEQDEEDDWYDDEEVEEGWSNKMVAQRTGQAPTPYSVYIKGKEWKSFPDDDHAENVANKLRAKFKADGRDPSVITIAATDYDKMDEEGKGTPVPAKEFARGVLKDLKKVNVKEAIGKNDLLSKITKDANKLFKKAKSGKLKSTGKDFTKGDHWTGPDKDDPSYTRNFGHGYPDTPSNRSHDRYVNKSLKNDDLDEAEGQLDEATARDVLLVLLDKFYADMKLPPRQGSHSGALDIKSPGTKVWTRGDGTRLRDPGRIQASYWADDKKQAEKAATNFWPWLLKQPGVKSIGQVSGEFGSSPMKDAVSYKGLYFSGGPYGTEFGSMSRIKNPRSVWRHKPFELEPKGEQGVAEGSFAHDQLKGEINDLFKPVVLQIVKWARAEGMTAKDLAGTSSHFFLDALDPDTYDRTQHLPDNYFNKLMDKANAKAVEILKKKAVAEGIVASGPSQPLDDRAVRKLVWDTMKINADTGEQAIQRALSVLAKKPQSRMVQDLQDKFQNLADRLSQGLAEARPITSATDTMAGAKKLWQYIGRNLEDLASNADFDAERNELYIDERLNNLFKTANGQPIKVAFDMSSGVALDKGILYIPIGSIWKYRGMYTSEKFINDVTQALSGQAVSEAETDYSKRRQRERDVDAGKPVAKQRPSKMTDYQKKRAQDKKDMELGEDQDTSGVESAIIRRIMVAHTDLLRQFGPEKVMQAAEEVAYNVGDVDEIGTSDVSAYVAQVKQILGVPEELDEKWSQKYKSSINCANPKGFSQKAHCAGKKK